MAVRMVGWLETGSLATGLLEYTPKRLLVDEPTGVWSTSENQGIAWLALHEKGLL